MSKIINERSKFKTEFFKLYYLSKIAGIASFSFNSGMEYKIHTSHTRLIWPFLIFITMITGNVFTFMRDINFNDRIISLFTYKLVIVIEKLNPCWALGSNE